LQGSVAMQLRRGGNFQHTYN